MVFYIAPPAETWFSCCFLLEILARFLSKKPPKNWKIILNHTPWTCSNCSSWGQSSTKCPLWKREKLIKSNTIHIQCRWNGPYFLRFFLSSFLSPSFWSNFNQSDWQKSQRNATQFWIFKCFLSKSKFFPNIQW